MVGQSQSLCKYLSSNISSRKIIPWIRFRVAFCFCLLYYVTKRSVASKVVEDIAQGPTASAKMVNN